MKCSFNIPEHPTAIPPTIGTALINIHLKQSSKVHEIDTELLLITHNWALI